MSKGVTGAVLGLVAGWFVGGLLRQSIGWTGVDSLAVLLSVVVLALMGANVGGLAGGLVGAIAGGVLGTMAVRLFMSALRLIVMVIGAILGWQLTRAND